MNGLDFGSSGRGVRLYRSCSWPRVRVFVVVCGWVRRQL